MAKKPDLDTVGEILRLHQELRGGRKLTAREQRIERRRILRLLRDGKSRWADFKRKQAAGENPPLPPPRSRIKARTEAKYKKLLQFLATLEYNSGRDLEYLRAYAPEERYSHLPKPPRGRAGRKAARSANRKRGDKTAMRIQRLVLRGMKPQQIARRTQLSLATVYRYLPK